MKIFAVINNYNGSNHSSPFYLSDSAPDWYEMPDSAVLRSGNPFFIPDFAYDFEAFPSLVYRIGRLGKSIAPRFATRYIDGVTMGAAVIATDLLKTLRRQGAPWTRATAFDRSFFLGNLQPIDALLNLDVAEIRYDDVVMTYRRDDILLGIDSIINRLSGDNTLKNGDLVLAGLTPEGIALRQDTRLTVTCNSNTTLLDINIK